VLRRAFKIIAVLGLTGVITVAAQHPTPDPQHKTVPAIDYGPMPKSPSIDHYYLDGDPEGGKGEVAQGAGEGHRH